MIHFINSIVLAIPLTGAILIVLCAYGLFPKEK